MQCPPDWARLLGDAREVSSRLRQLAQRAGDIAAAGRREKADWWSGKPRLAGGYRELAAEARRCAVLAASFGLRVPGGDGSTWIEAAASCRQAADAWERLARSWAGWGWRKPMVVGALQGFLAGLIAAAAAGGTLSLLGAW